MKAKKRSGERARAVAIKGSVKRRIGYAIAYEIIAMICTTAILVAMGHDLVKSLPMALAISLIALAWNYIWNTIFETIERKMNWKGRSIGNRILHAIGFEGGMALITIVVMALWLNISLLEALVTEIGILVFFLVYTYAYNLAFDKLFGLPESAR